MMRQNSWSPDACVGEALASGRFKRSEIVCTKTLYNYIDLGLLYRSWLLAVKNTDLPQKLRRNTKIFSYQKI